jgi:hypothetical protein
LEASLFQNWVIAICPPGWFKQQVSWAENNSSLLQLKGESIGHVVGLPGMSWTCCVPNTICEALVHKSKAFMTLNISSQSIAGIARRMFMKISE